MHRLYTDCILSLLPNGKVKTRYPIIYNGVEVPVGFEVKLQQNNIAPAQIFYEYLLSIGNTQLANKMLKEISEALEVDENDRKNHFCEKFLEKKINALHRLCRALKKQFGKQEIKF